MVQPCSSGQRGSYCKVEKGILVSEGKFENILSISKSLSSIIAALLRGQGSIFSTCFNP